MVDPKATIQRLPGEVLGGRFRVDRMLGKGGMGSVMAATDTKTGRKVALKVMRSTVARDPTAVERFKREGEILRAVNHPSIVGVEDAGRLDDGTMYLALELLEGETLEARLKDGGPIPAALLVPVVRGLCEALEAVHAAGIVHRDVKPSNIFLPEPAVVRKASISADAVMVKLVDFGVAKVWTGDKLTAAGLAVGTAKYMAPEQLAARPDLDGRADVYAVGVVAYEALTGVHPFAAAGKGRLIEAILGGQATPMGEAGEVDKAGQVLAAVVGKAMALDKENRFASAGEFSEAFTRAVHRPHLFSEPPLDEDAQRASVSGRPTAPDGPPANVKATVPERPIRMPDTRLRAPAPLTSAPPPPPTNPTWVWILGAGVMIGIGAAVSLLFTGDEVAWFESATRVESLYEEAMPHLGQAMREHGSDDYAGDLEAFDELYASDELNLPAMSALHHRTEEARADGTIDADEATELFEVVRDVVAHGGQFNDAYADHVAPGRDPEAGR